RRRGVRGRRGRGAARRGRRRGAALSVGVAARALWTATATSTTAVRTARSACAVRDAAQVLLVARRRVRWTTTAAATEVAAERVGTGPLDHGRVHAGAVRTCLRPAGLIRAVVRDAARLAGARPEASSPRRQALQDVDVAVPCRGARHRHGAGHHPDATRAL